MKVLFLNIYYYCLVDQVHQLHVIKIFFYEFIFHTREREKGKKTQNSGVTVFTEVSSFASVRDTNPISGYVSY